MRATVEEIQQRAREQLSQENAALEAYARACELHYLTAPEKRGGHPEHPGLMGLQAPHRTMLPYLNTAEQHQLWEDEMADNQLVWDEVRRLRGYK